MNRKLANLFIRVLLPLLCTLVLSAAANAQVTVFDPATGNVSIPLLKKDGKYYANAVLNLAPNGGWSFTTPGTDSHPTSKAAAPYNSASGVLAIPYLQIDNSFFYNVALTLPAGQAWKLNSYGDFNQMITMSSPLTFPIKTTADNWWATDTGGVMSYMLDNGQVWRIVTDDPCFPPLTIPTGAPPAGKANVWIYPNPDNTIANYVMITTYNNGAVTAEESCIVTPVSVPGLEVTGTGQPFDVSQSGLTGAIGKYYDFYVAGGTKPYMLQVDNSALASVQFLPQAPQDIGGQAVRVTFNQQGTATLSVYDFNRLKKQVALTAQTDMQLIPSDITVTAGLAPINVLLTGGVPPFRVFNPSPTLVANTDLSQINDTDYVMTLTFTRDTGGLKMPILVIDSTGAKAGVTVTVSANAIVNGGTTTSTGTTTSKPYK